MDQNRKHDDRQRQAQRLIPTGLLSYVAAAGLAIPVGTVAWLEAVYLRFGLTGEDPSEAFHMVSAVVVFSIAFGWPLFRAHRSAQVVRRGCQLGLLVSGLLPVVAFAVMLLWENAAGRPDLGMGGLMLYALPWVAMGVAAVLCIVFALGIRLAERRLAQQ